MFVTKSHEDFCFDPGSMEMRYAARAGPVTPASFEAGVRQGSDDGYCVSLRLLSSSIPRYGGTRKMFGGRNRGIRKASSCTESCVDMVHTYRQS